MEGVKQSNEIETKNKVSTKYMLELMNSKNISEERRGLLFTLKEKKVDYRTLLKMKNHVFDSFPADHEISVEEWKAESARFLHIHDEKVQEQLLADISVSYNNSFFLISLIFTFSVTAKLIVIKSLSF